jgi:hypothetical protein
MKRPPKVKSAAAAARNAAGAGSGTPDFYRIEKIAPLPPATAFRPVARESKIDGDGPRYEIETLDFKDGNETLEEMSMIGWSTPQSDGMNNITGGSQQHTIPFSDPFAEGRTTSSADGNSSKQPETMDTINHSDDSSNSNESSHHSSVKQDEQQSVSSADKETDKASPLPSQEASNGDTTNSTTDADTKAENQSQKLSKADLTYLKHQNRMLLLHAEKGSNAAKKNTKL